jgi:hypothetical protein
MSKLNRKLSYQHYIEIENKHKKTNIHIFKNIIDKLNNKLSINDFFLDKSCRIERFVLYSDKIKDYLYELSNIEKILMQLYNDGKISYVGFQ